MKYAEAVSHLDALVEKIEDPQRDLTGIADDVRKAMELVRWCKEYIRKGEAETENLIVDEQDTDNENI